MFSKRSLRFINMIRRAKQIKKGQVLPTPKKYTQTAKDRLSNFDDIAELQ